MKSLSIIEVRNYCNNLMQIIHELTLQYTIGSLYSGIVGSRAPTFPSPGLHSNALLGKEQSTPNRCSRRAVSSRGWKRRSGLSSLFCIIRRFNRCISQGRSCWRGWREGRRAATVGCTVDFTGRPTSGWINSSDDKWLTNDGKPVGWAAGT